MMTLGLLIIAFLIGTISRAFLYWRLTPYGAPFVTYWERYFFHAVFYSQVSLWAMGLPWLAWNGLRWSKRSRRHSFVYFILITLLALNLMADHADHEIMRFAGVHPTPSFLLTYQGAGQTHTLNDALTSDAGGPGLPVALLIVLPITFVTAALFWLRKLSTGRIPRLSPIVIGLLIFIPVIWVSVSLVTSGGKFRQRKVQPYMMSLWDELNADWTAGQQPLNYNILVQNYQSEWLTKNTDSKNWQFLSADYPFLRTPQNPRPTPVDMRWNIVFLQLETLRGWDTGHLRPDRKFPNPTPFLDSLAQKGAYWTRFTTFGPPTVSGFMSAHCSITPHSRHNLIVSFPHTCLTCLPAELRKIGYQAEYFTSSDPDWDSQRLWLDRWFDRHVYDRAADEQDHVLFAQAADRLVELGRRGPFMATIVSITNHYPFQSRRAQSDIAGQDSFSDKILNTLHYTDEAVELLFRKIETEPWFDRTLFFVYGDHGYNLGEHDGAPGQRNGYRESTWSPLIIVGPHPDLPLGRHNEVATLLDLVPTAASLIGLDITNPWQGIDLTSTGGKEQTFVHTKNNITFAETPEFSMVVDRESGKISLFSAQDFLQSVDISAKWPHVGVELADRAAKFAELNDYIIETNRVCPR
ncbi:MAG: sulfatase-like hydrolase/transferase [Myxococcales bacterium]|nr:sulfatase-like hydrolase/transferase [Myxococcales bacterium]